MKREDHHLPWLFHFHGKLQGDYAALEVSVVLLKRPVALAVSTCNSSIRKGKGRRGRGSV